MLSGYIKKYIESLYFRFVLEPSSADMYPGDIQQIIVQHATANTEGLSELLDSYMKYDKERYFYAKTDEERASIKGAFNRTALLVNLSKGKLHKPSSSKIEDINLDIYG